MNSLNTDYKIIAVDKNNSISKALKKMVKSDKYSLKNCNKISEVLEEIQVKNYDILLLDFSDKPKEKLKVLQQIRNINQEIYIIVLIDQKIPKSFLKELKELSVQGYCEKNDKLEQLPLFIESAVKSIDQMRTIRNINEELMQSKEKIEKAYLESIETLRFTVEAKDNYTLSY